MAYIRESITSKQIGYIRALEKALKKSVGRDISNYSKLQGSNYIDKMLTTMKERGITL